MNSVFKKIAFRTTVLFMCILIFAATGAVMHFDYTYRQDTQENLAREAQIISRIIKSADSFVSLSEYIDSSGDVHYTVIDMTGAIIINTEAYAVEKLDFLSKPEIIEAINTGSGVDIRYVESRQEARMYVSVRAENEYIIRTSTQLRGKEFFTTSVLLPFIIITILAIVLCLIVALSVSRSITKPLVALKKRADFISLGKTDDRKIYTNEDELQSLSRSINNMIEKLESNIQDMAEKNSRLNAVLQAIPSGILAVDVDEFVIMANPAAMEMFGFQERSADVKTLAMKRYAKLKEIVRKSMYASGVIKDELSLKGQDGETLLQVFAVPAHNDGVLYGVIVLAQDITQVRKLKNLQSDFIANVSHELRTPLTAISGFVETLRAGKVPSDDANRFLDIINLETERLTGLIDNILVLSKLEQVSSAVSHSFLIRDEIKQAVALIDVNAKNKRVNITLSLAEETMRVRTKKDHIKQLMINLVSNAVKYTPENGEVRVSLLRKDSNAVIIVEDNGIGIPEEDIPRLFERFYRVDKSRSRALGGTGLGLAIVKQIVVLLDGRIEVESTLGKGSKFSVYLPLVDLLPSKK